MRLWRRPFGRARPWRHRARPRRLRPVWIVCSGRRYRRVLTDEACRGSIPNSEKLPLASDLLVEYPGGQCETRAISSASLQAA
jgi:hypothetical protein